MKKSKDKGVVIISLILSFLLTVLLAMGFYYCANGSFDYIRKGLPLLEKEIINDCLITNYDGKQYLANVNVTVWGKGDPTKTIAYTGYYFRNYPLTTYEQDTECNFIDSQARTPFDFISISAYNEVFNEQIIKINEREIENDISLNSIIQSSEDKSYLFIDHESYETLDYDIYVESKYDFVSHFIVWFSIIYKDGDYYLRKINTSTYKKEYLLINSDYYNLFENNELI